VTPDVDTLTATLVADDAAAWGVGPYTCAVVRDGDEWLWTVADGERAIAGGTDASPGRAVVLAHRAATGRLQ
jgi:hypothetical protein